jgi:hypothetical protein
VRVLLASAAILALFGGKALAEDRVALGAEELDGMRGGFELPGGQQIDFGAVVKTYVDGQLALQTRLSWTPQGVATAVEGGGVTPDLAAAAAAYGLKLDGASNGVLVPGEGGATAVLHDLGGERIAGVVINNASNRDIRQATEVTLNLPDFPQMSADFMSQRADLRLQDAVAAALRDTAIR